MRPTSTAPFLRRAPVPSSVSALTQPIVYSMHDRLNRRRGSTLALDNTPTSRLSAYAALRRSQQSSAPSQAHNKILAIHSQAEKRVRNAVPNYASNPIDSSITAAVMSKKGSLISGTSTVSSSETTSFAAPIGTPSIEQNAEQSDKAAYALVCIEVPIYI